VKSDFAKLPQRSKAAEFFRESPLDLLVVGGGIVGAGIIRDAAMRGLRAGLVEQHDFAFGTSSRSSRLLHGGMRYLAQGRIGLVRESSVEKTIVQHIAQHLAEPLAFVFPTFRGNRNWKLWQLKIGVKIYDLLCSGRNFGKSTWLSRDETLQKVPSLRHEGLNGSVRYFDAFTNDARLVLDTLCSAAKNGAALLNYCRFKTASHNEFWECEVEDLLTAETYKLQARAVVNATGPWADGLPHSQVKLRLTKGIHLVIDRKRLPLTDTLVMTEGKRILFAVPWGERLILGTTDTDYNGSLDDVRVEAADVRYVLDIANQHFPDVSLRTKDVIGSWAGLRPLIADPHGKPSDISRSHQIDNPETGWWDVAGGKLTTYRLMAEQTVDQIVKWLSAWDRSSAAGWRGGVGITHPANSAESMASHDGKVGRGVPTAPPNVKKAFSKCRTATEPLLSPAETEGVSGILPPEFCRKAVEHYCANEWAIDLEDVMVRRTRWHYYFPNAAQMADQVADWMSELLGWSEVTRSAQLHRYHQLTCGSEDSQNSHKHSSANIQSGRRVHDEVHG
jgi:glycerol-3-phosphate dehydrogenase